MYTAIERLTLIAVQFSHGFPIHALQVSVSDTLDSSSQKSERIDFLHSNGHLFYPANSQPKEFGGFKQVCPVRVLYNVSSNPAHIRNVYDIKWKVRRGRQDFCPHPP